MKPTANQIPDTISAPRTDPVYNCHGYLTKVPLAAIEPFIESFTKSNEVVADFFAGSGMTGLAAARLGRRARLSDISVLGRHIAEGYLTQVSHPTLQSAAAEVISKARALVGPLYSTRRLDDGATVDFVRTVWSFTYLCPSCHQDLVYYRHLSPKGKPPKNCPKCQQEFVRRKWQRGADVPVQVIARNVQGRMTEQPIADFDLMQIHDAMRDPRLDQVPSLEISPEREMFGRSGLGKAGLTKTHQFFSPRNAIALLELWRTIRAVGDVAIRKKLSFAFTAILPRASRRYQWSPQRPLNAQNQTYYIAPVYYEWNVFELFQRKVEAAIRSDEELFGAAPLLQTASSAKVTYDLQSADRLLHLGAESVDYVFTDPPFGSNIFYSDMNLFHEAWLGTITDHSCEAVVHTTGKKKEGAASRYEKLLMAAFSESFRILKPGRYMSVVFGNSSGRIWGLVQRAIREAGFKAAPVQVAILDKGQRSVKGLNSGSEGVVTVDLILTMQKPTSTEPAEEVHDLRNGDTQALIAEAITELSTQDASNASYVYARILRKAIQKHYVLDDLHLGDVLVALRNEGYKTDHKTGLLVFDEKESPPRSARVGLKKRVFL